MGNAEIRQDRYYELHCASLYDDFVFCTSLEKLLRYLEENKNLDSVKIWETEGSGKRVVHVGTKYEGSK